MPQGLPKRIRFAFIMQALLASVLMVAGVLVIGTLMRNLFVERSLQAEASSFWEAMDGTGGPLPKSASIRGWFVPAGGDASHVPDALRASAPGKASVVGGGRVLVERRAEGDLYLSMSTQQIDWIAAMSAAVLIASGLLVILLVTWLTYQRSRRMVLPVNRLADVVSQWDPGTWDAGTQAVLPYPLATDNSKEMRALSTALGGLATRIAEFVQRERDFTRDASHELRTPLTVVRIATDMMLGDPALPKHSQRPLVRIQRAVGDMESLVDAFLVLARARDVAPQSEAFAVADVVADEVEKVRPLVEGKGLELRFVTNASPRMFAPPRVLGVMIGHLLSNACAFTESGSVEVVVDDDRILVRDTGIGMSAHTLEHVYEPFFRADQFNPVGKGIGMTIVRRLGERFGWPVALESVQGEGTVATVRFVPFVPNDA